MSWRNMFGRKRPLDTQIDSELRFHIDRVVEEKIAAGLTREQARREASIEFGGREQIQEEVRDVYRIAALDIISANIKSGLRLMRKSPSFSIAVILTLALGIGANSAVFSAINAILLRPLPFPNGDKLMVLHEYDRKAQNPVESVAPIRLEDWNRLNSTFQAISGWYNSDVSETAGALPERVTEAIVAPRFLQVWGVSPALGRDFSPEEEHFGGPSVVLISDRYWRRHFHADASAIGKTMRLEQYSATVIGVLPASFLFPDHDVDIWVSNHSDAPYAQDRASTWFTAIGRLKPGVTIAQARGNLANVQTQLGRQFPKTDAGLGVQLQPLKETTVGSVRRSLWVLFGSVSLLLLIACTNIAALLLARTTEREREFSVRFSLGASRASVVAQLLTETLVLALAGSVLGMIVAAAGSYGFRMLAKSIPRIEEVIFDWRILLYNLACALVATLVCGLFPAIRSTRRSIAGDLARGSRTQVSTRNPVQWFLVGIQVALAVTLLVGAGLLLRTFQELGKVSAGFETSHILTFQVSANWGETVDRKKLGSRIQRTLDAMRALPGVRAAASAGSLPGIAGDSRTEVKVLEGRSYSEGKIVADSRFVSDGYFSTMQIPILAGVDCRQSDHFYDTVLVNRSFANKYLGNARSIGRHLQLVSSQFLPSPMEIRGIVADAREQGLNQEPGPTIYTCVSAPGPSPHFLIQVRGEPMALADSVRREIHRIEPARSVFGISPLNQHLSDTFAESRVRTTLLTMFSLTAVSLACIGLYGTLSYFVTVRRREVGLRLALGALRGQIVRRFLFEGLAVSLLGCIAGVCLSVIFAHTLAGMLYGVSTTDSITFISVVSLILCVAAIASFIPALRAAYVEPMQVLRDE